jgi:hypothetical protein
VPDGPNIHWVSSSKERAFWERFCRIHPRPPEYIEREQSSVALDFFGKKSLNEEILKHLSANEITRGKEITRAETIASNYPSEAFTDEALFWSYVKSQREEYQKLAASKIGASDHSVENFLKELVVDSKYITEPLNDLQLQNANAWKVPYLQRLRQEKTDEQYVQAYLKAWNLSEEEVFGKK